ncbi:hypothetical protein ACHAWF_016385, partial [Thalassiosira exigua]
HPLPEHAGVDVLGQGEGSDLPEAVRLAVDRQSLPHQGRQKVRLDGRHVRFGQDEGLVALLQQPEKRVEREGGPLQMRQLRVDLGHAEEYRLVGSEASRLLHSQFGVVRLDPPLDACAELVLCEEDEVGALPGRVGFARGEPEPVLREEGCNLNQLELDEGQYEGSLQPLASDVGDAALEYRRGDAISHVEVGVIQVLLLDVCPFGSHRPSPGASASIDSPSSSSAIFSSSSSSSSSSPDPIVISSNTAQDTPTGASGWSSHQRTSWSRLGSWPVRASSHGTMPRSLSASPLPLELPLAGGPTPSILRRCSSSTERRRPARYCCRPRASVAVWREAEATRRAAKVVHATLWTGESLAHWNGILMFGAAAASSSGARF